MGGNVIIRITYRYLNKAAGQRHVFCLATRRLNNKEI
jgi:hypothetical protein